MDNPFADLVIGNVGHIKSEQHIGTFQAVETRAIKEKRLAEEAVQSKVETEIIKEKSTMQQDTSGIVPEEVKSEEETQNQSVNLSISKDTLRQEQEKDDSLANVRAYAIQRREVNLNQEQKKNSYFVYENNILYRVFIGKSCETIKQIVVPKKYRNRLLAIAHDVPLGGHLGNKKTREKLLQNVFWPGIFIDVARDCKTCSQCQKM